MFNKIIECSSGRNATVTYTTLTAGKFKNCLKKIKVPLHNSSGTRPLTSIFILEFSREEILGDYWIARKRCTPKRSLQMKIRPTR
jgi:hypothetical protein